MSEEGLSQNGGAITKEAISSEEAKVEPVPILTNQSVHTSDIQSSQNDISNSNDTDTSINQSDSLPTLENQSVPSEHENQEGKDQINKITNENEDTVAKAHQEDVPSHSRELKSLLALSKDAKLDTNISRKRKVVNLRKKIRTDNRLNQGKIPKIQYPVTAESELEMELQSVEKVEGQEDGGASIASTVRTIKRKKSILSDASLDSFTEESPKKARKSFSVDVAVFKVTGNSFFFWRPIFKLRLFQILGYLPEMLVKPSITGITTFCEFIATLSGRWVKPNKDKFCWRCHKDGVNISCETCPRSYHQRCLKQTITDSDHWPCPECVSILKAESTQSRSPAMRGMTLENLCSLLKFAVNRMIECQGSEPFIHPVNDNEFPEYKKYIIQPMDLTLLEKNIKENLYGSTQAFEADAKWILHNSIIFNSYQSKLTSVAKFIIKICKQEMSEIENCPSCYLNANTKKKTWFVEVCPKPHLLVWAKLRGFPFWPGKAMRCKDGLVDVRFFGAHDRAWVPAKECFLYSPKDPNLFRAKRADIEQCVEELEVHVQNLKRIYVEFHYPAFKTPLDPDNEVKQLQVFLPRYKSYYNKHKLSKKHSLEKETVDIKKAPTEKSEESNNEKPKEHSQKNKLSQEAPQNEENNESRAPSTEDEAMEGYGTDDESIPQIDTELRRTLLKKPKKNSEIGTHEADDDDTQMPANIEPDISGNEEVVLTRKTVRSFSGNKNQNKSGSEPSSKRPSFDDSTPSPVKGIRRNSETKIDSTRVSDKISKIDILEDVEISLGNDNKGKISCIENISSSNSECSSDFSVEIKKKPVQVDVDNVEFTISPASKFSVSDKLMKRLSDIESEDGSSGGLEKAEQIKRSFTENESLFEKQPVGPFSDEAVSDSKESDANPVSSTHRDTEEHVPKENLRSEANIEPVSNTDQEVIPNDEKLEENDVSEPAKDANVEIKESGDMPSETSAKEDFVEVNCDKSECHENDTSNETGKDRDESVHNSTRTAKNLSWTIKDAAVEWSPSKVILKAIRTEEKLDQLMKKSMEAEESRKSSEAEDPQESGHDKTNFDASAANSKSAGNKETAQPKSVQSKTPSPDKFAALIKEKRHSTSREKDTSALSRDDRSDGANSTNREIGKCSAKDVDKNIKSNKSPIKSSKPQNDLESHDGVENEEVLEEVNLNLDKANIINIIHSSLNDSKSASAEPTDHGVNDDTREPGSKNILATRSSKRKKSLELDQAVLETQNKILRLVSIESIMNKANNNQDKDRDDDVSILKASLESKKATKPSSLQTSPRSSARNSVHEALVEEIKSEPESEAEPTNGHDLEAKKKYLSALNILEKGEADAQQLKSNEIRTRSKTEEKRERFRVSNEPQIADNMTKIIEDVAVNYSATHEDQTTTNKKPSNMNSDGCEIYVKSFAKIAADTTETIATVTPTPPSKQRARKSFPQPNYTKPVVRPSPTPTISREHLHVATSTPVTTEASPRLVPRTTIATSSPISTATPTIPQTHTLKTSIPPLQQLENMRPANGYLILQQPQQDNIVFLPPNQTINYSTSMGSQVMSVTPCLLPTPSNAQTVRHLTQPQTWPPNQNLPDLNTSDSQNYIPQGELGGKGAPVNSAMSTVPTSDRILLNGLSEPSLTSSAMEISSNNAVSTTPTTSNDSVRPTETVSEAAPEPSQPIEPTVLTIGENGDDEEFVILNSLATENLTRAVTEIIRRPPPKLKPRPPGIFSQQFSEGPPSSAGPVAERINSVAHRLADYFRGMLIETLGDLGKTNNPEASVANLKLEIETLKNQHKIEISEIEKNMCTILKDLQQSIIEDRDKVIQETRSACEAEAVKRVEEAKSKQWCANCSKEAQFYCCWNTSYCDYPCQQKHWPNHMSKCTQNVNQPSQINPSSTIRPSAQQLILRPANPPPKGGIGRVFTKPLQKVYMNRTVTTPKTMRVQTSTGSVLTMMETTPGNYQLMASNSLVRTGPTLSTIRPAGLISIPSSVGNANISSNPLHKGGTTKQPIRTLTHSVPVTTILEEDSD